MCLIQSFGILMLIDYVFIMHAVAGAREEPARKALPNVRFFGACVWHMMTIDFPKNLGHIPSHEEVKFFVYNNLVRNTASNPEWEMHL